jgi:energy-coupling factor transporter ATP-binding protein EcfA2
MASAAISRRASTQTCSEQLARFQAFTVAHPHLLTAKESLMTAIRESEPNSIVMVFGPTGVGKTTLRLRTELILIEELRPELDTNRWRVPVASVEAIAPDSGSFCWRSHYKRLLQAMGDPLTDRRRVPGSDSDNQEERFKLTARSSGSEYRYAVEQALRFRRPAAVMIDEAQHLGKVASGRRLLDQLDVIKSIANRTNTVHVLFGTYDLLAFRNLSGQLSRRSVDLHFPRYRAHDAEDRKIFVNIVHSFQKKLPLPEPPNLVRHWELLYERTSGCVGMLKQWLVKALAAALRRGDSTISVSDLEAHALSIAQCDRILSEITEGEARLNEGDGARSKLRARLGLATAVAPAPALSGPAGTDTRHKLKPGQRRRVRDPVGQPAYAARV